MLGAFGHGKETVNSGRSSQRSPRVLLSISSAPSRKEGMQLSHKSKRHKGFHRGEGDDDCRDTVGGRRCLLPQIDQGHRQALHGREFCRQWVVRHREEETVATGVFHVARELFYDVTLRRNVFSITVGMDQLRVLAAKAAVSCFLLEGIVEALPRHQVLRSCVGTLLRGVYVPDTEEMRQVLGGTLHYPAVLEDFPLDSTSRSLLSRYARKTYFIAHYELTQAVISYAHANLSLQQHFKRLPRIFALLNANWIKSFMRTVLRAWKRVCHNRRQNEQKYRARWAKRFALERIRAGVRRWRVYASVRLHSVAAADSIKARILALNRSINRLEKEIETLESESAGLSVELENREEHYIALEKRMAETEREYKKKLEQVREIDCVGSRLLGSLLVKMPFPTDIEAFSALEVLVLWANTSLMESPLGPLFVEMTDDGFVESIGNFNLMNSSSMKLENVDGSALPFTPLLEETTTVYLPMHCLLALIRALDFDSLGPSKEDLKEVCIADAQVRELRARMENEVVNDADSRVLAVLQQEEKIGQMLINAYQTLTGSICIVTAEQLMTRQRRVQLVFLAGLMRYFSNWVGNKVKKHRPVVESHTLPQLAVMEEFHGESAGTGVEEALTLQEGKMGIFGVNNHYGVRDRKSAEWYHPPQNHVHWPLWVENQRRWIAASLSALHSAVNVAAEPHVVFTTELQNDTPLFMERVTLARLSDILPRDAIHSKIFFLLARCVEGVFPSLRALFLQYAVERRGGGDKDTAARYITALDFWRMLRDCRVIGGRGKLHRAVVRRIVAKVTNDISSKPSESSIIMNRTTSGVMRSRPMRDTAEIDLKNSHYKIRLSAAEFVEALLRCAQVWDSMRQQLQEKAAPVDSGNAAVEVTGGPDGKAKAKKVVAVVRYDAHDPAWALKPTVLSEFLRDWIVAHGFRGPTLDPFRRAMRHAKLRECLGINQERLFSIFTIYAKPKEAYGIRLAPQDGDTSARRAQSKASPSFSIDNVSANTTTTTTTTTTSGTHSSEVGIVRVMTLQAAQLMATECEWFGIRRVTSYAIEEAFKAVAADAEREPGVIFFPEWLDLLCVVAHYYEPNPTLPLHEKLVRFLREYVLRFYRGDD